MIVRRWDYSSSSKHSSGQKKDLSPLPPPLSPAKAKQQYLKSVEVIDPQTKIIEMNKELDIVRERMATKLDKEINKSVWRKLTDPLRRYKHSLINIGAVLFAYILAHNLYVTAKKERQGRSNLKASQVEVQELKSLLQSLLKPETLQEIASSCVEKVTADGRDTVTSTTKSSWWRTTRPRLSNDDALEEGMVEALKAELEQRIGEKALTEDQRKQKTIEYVWKESKSKVDELSENPELLLQALEEQLEEQDDKNKKERRVFSM